MVNFKKLVVKTPAEREADDARRHAEDIALDRARRRERSEKILALVLTTDAEVRFTFNGGSAVHIRGRDDRGRPTSATWYAPGEFDRDRIDEILRRLPAETAVRLDGYWRYRTVNGAKLFEFAAQFLAIGDEPPVP